MKPVRIIQIRAPMGGGKTYVMRKVLERFQCSELDERLNGRGTRPEAYGGANGRLAVLGPYIATCGGMDAVNTVAASIELIDRYAEKYKLVTYEGMMLGHIYGRHGAHVIGRYREKHLFVFIDTPLDVCVERVLQRRAERGADTENFDPKNIKQSYDTVWSSHDRIKSHGGNILVVKHKVAARDIGDLINQNVGGRYAR